MRSLFAVVALGLSLHAVGCANMPKQRPRVLGSYAPAGPVAQVPNNNRNQPARVPMAPVNGRTAVVPAVPAVQVPAMPGQTPQVGVPGFAPVNGAAVPAPGGPALQVPATPAGTPQYYYVPDGQAPSAPGTISGPVGAVPVRRDPVTGGLLPPQRPAPLDMPAPDRLFTSGG